MSSTSLPTDHASTSSSSATTRTSGRANPDAAARGLIRRSTSPQIEEPSGHREVDTHEAHESSALVVRRQNAEGTGARGLGFDRDVVVDILRLPLEGLQTTTGLRLNPPPGPLQPAPLNGDEFAALLERHAANRGDAAARHQVVELAKWVIPALVVIYGGSSARAIAIAGVVYAVMTYAATHREDMDRWVHDAVRFLRAEREAVDTLVRTGAQGQVRGRVIEDVTDVDAKDTSAAHEGDATGPSEGPLHREPT